MTRKCPSQGRVRGKTQSGTAPSQSMSNRGAPRHIVLSGRLRSDPGLEWLGCGGEGRAYLQGGKPLLELPMSSPQISFSILLQPARISLTSEMLMHFTPHEHSVPSKWGYQLSPYWQLWLGRARGRP